MVAAVIDFKPRRGRPPVHEPDEDHRFHASEEQAQARHLASILRRLHLMWRAEDEVGFYRMLKEAEYTAHRWERRWDGDVA
jgi:hypothetical protein